LSYYLRYFQYSLLYYWNFYNSIDNLFYFSHYLHGIC
jgi:hypothetical protein